MRAAIGGVLLLLATAARAAPASEELLYFHCPKGGGEYDATITTQILLAKALLDPALSEKENVELAAQHQLRYFWGITRADPRWQQRMQVVLSRQDPIFTIQKIEPTTYGRDLVVDWPRKEERLQIEPGYIARAVAKGRLDKSDPAIRATVEIRFQVALCAAREQPDKTLTTPLPYDPWLMHWLVPRREFKSIRYFKVVEETNPCVDDDFADLPHPYYYWYDWYPTRRGRDARQRPFDCTKLLRPGRDYAHYPITLGPRRRATGKFAPLAADLRRAATSRPLAVTIMVGILDHTVTGLDLPRWRAALGEGRDTLATVAAAAQKVEAAERVHERGLAMWLLSIAELGKLLTGVEHKTTIEGEYLVAEISGKLAQSQQPIRLRVVLGMTDVFGPKPPAHWRYLERGLVEDDVVLYWGHSGIGENFRLAQIGRHLARTPAQLQQALDRAPLLLVGFISCYSYMYFGEDLIAAGKQRQAGGTFLFTGMGAVKKDRGPIPVIELLDRLLDPAQATDVDRVPIGDEELWIVKRIARAAR